MVATDWRKAPLGPADIALCEFAEALTSRPQQMTPAMLDSLRTQGFSDVAIHDATQIIGYFNYINRVADALGVDFDDGIKPWEKGPESV